KAAFITSLHRHYRAHKKVMFMKTIAFDQQVVLITGGARGLGKSLTQAFLRQGARVVINYFQSQQAAQALADQAGADKAIAIQADISDAKATNAMVKHAEQHFNAPITTVVNNALPKFFFDGDNRPKVEDLTWQRLTQQHNGINQGLLNTTKATLDGMKAQQFG